MPRSLINPGHRRKSKKREADSLGAFATTSGAWDVLLLPSMIVADVSIWYDRSGKGHHGTPTAGCTYDTSQGLPSLLLNGAGQYIQGSLSGISDDALTIFVLEQTLDSYAGSRGVIVELTDNAGTVFERSVSVSRQFAVDTARSAAVDTANAGKVPPVGTETNVTLHVATFTAATRALLTQGKARAGSAVAVTPARSDILYRIGAYFAAGGGAWHGRAFALGIVAGVLNERERAAAQSFFLSMAGIAEPYKYGDEIATNIGTDPQFNFLPEIDAVPNRRVQLFKWCCARRDGGDNSIVASCSLPFDGDVPDDRWSVTPPAAGTYPFSIATTGGYSATSDIVAVDLPGIGAGAKVVCVIGDSQTARAVAAEEILKGILGSKISFVGGVTPPAGYTQNTEGHDGEKWAYFNTSGSPLWAGGAALDIAGWKTNISAPTIHGYILAPGQNDAHAATPATIDAVCATAFTTHAEPIIAAIRADDPSAIIWVSLNYCLSADPALWNSAAQRTEFFYKVYRYAQLALAQFGGREADNIFVMDPSKGIDPILGYGPDPIHMIAEPGHRQLAEVWLAAFCRRFWS